MNLVMRKFSGTSLSARVLRSSFLTVGGFGFGQVLRLASNLLLTRLLFPEAFGMMALVMVFLQGLAMFSDVGVTPAIMQSKRGDEPDFLNTAWTIQVIRGFALCFTACLFAWPMATFYGEPQLMYLLPAASITLIINGFNPTRMDSANRHLKLGRVTLLEMGTQLTGTVTAVLLAWLTGSVWALVISGLISATVHVIINSMFLPGERNRFYWDKSAANELINFGKWIFLSTICGFFVLQGDKILFGKYLPLDAFGVYNIGFFLASFPMLLGGLAIRKVLIPIYRESPPGESIENFKKLRKMRMLVTSFLLILVSIFATVGVWLADFMYDSRYEMAGAVIVLMACMQIPQIIVVTYDQATLAAGDSKPYFVLAASRAVFTIFCLLVGLEMGGLLGGIIAQGVAVLLVYPVVVWLARKSSAWDPMHDAIFSIAGILIAFGALTLNWDHVFDLANAGY